MGPLEHRPRRPAAARTGAPLPDPAADAARASVALAVRRRPGLPRHARCHRAGPQRDPHRDVHLEERRERPPFRRRRLHQGAGGRPGPLHHRRSGLVRVLRRRRGADAIRRRADLDLPSGRSLAPALGLAGARPSQADDHRRTGRLRWRDEPGRRLRAGLLGRPWLERRARPDRGPRVARAAAPVRAELELRAT